MRDNNRQKKYPDHKSRLKNKFMDLNAIYYCIMIFMNPSTILKNILLCIGNVTINESDN